MALRDKRLLVRTYERHADVAAFGTTNNFTHPRTVVVSCLADEIMRGQQEKEDLVLRLTCVFT